MTVSIERESVEGFDLPVTTSDDPSATTVEFAFTPVGNTRPQAGDWHSGFWKSTAQGVSGRWNSLASTPLIGVGAVDLGVGTWQAWIRITDAPEAAMWKADRVKIT